MIFVIIFSFACLSATVVGVFIPSSFSFSFLFLSQNQRLYRQN